MRIILAALAATLALAPATAHEAMSGWHYPKECCSDKDCNVLASSRVRVTPSGYVIDEKHLVPHSRALFSPDKFFHACFPSSVDKLGCFWAPQPAM